MVNTGVTRNVIPSVADSNYIRTASDTDLVSYFNQHGLFVGNSILSAQNGREVLVGINHAIADGFSVGGSVKVRTLKKGVLGVSNGVHIQISPTALQSSKSARSTGSHEYGHNVNKAVLKKLYGNTPSLLSVTDWNKGTTAGDIVRTAFKSWKKATGSKMTIKQARRSISRYATTNMSETLAEAFSKYYTKQVGQGSFEQYIVNETKVRLK